MKKNRALKQLERAFEERCGALARLCHDPVWGSLQGEQRSQTLLRKMNLVT